MILPPPDESARLAALKRYAILDTPAEAEFDDLTQLAAQICGTPIALVSLVGANRQWFKSKLGIAATETPRDIAFCSHGIAGAGLFEVPDATQDDRFKDNPLAIGEPNIRFYAGAPLTTPEGHNIGMLCVKDTVPRQLTPKQREALARLGRQVVAQMELRLANRRLAEQAGFQQTILTGTASAIIAATPEGIITHFNPAAERMLGYTAAEMIGKQTLGVFHDPAEVVARAPGLSAELGREIAPGFEVFVAKARAGQTETREWTYVRKDGSRLPVLLSVSAWLDVAGQVSGFLGTARDLTERTLPETQVEASDSRLRDFFHHAVDLIQGVAPDGRLLFTNHAWRETLGYSEAETESLNVFAVLHPECREHCGAIFQRLMKGEDVGLVDVTFVSKAGRRIEAEGSVNVRFENGQPVSTRGIFREVTARRAAEAEAGHARREATRRAEQVSTFQGTLLALRDHEGEKMSAFLRVVTSGIAHALNTERTSVWFFDANHTAIECQDLFILSTLNHERGLPLAATDYPRYFKAINNHESVLADDARTHPATSEFTTGYLDPLGITSMLDVPIRAGGYVAGVLCCEHTGPARQWTAEENKFAIAAASYIMLALEQAERRKAEVALRDLNERLESLVQERTAALAESERFNSATLNALSAHVAVLDAAGVILTTNAAWRDFAEASGTAWQRVSEGVNYLGICAAATDEHASEAHPAAAGIREVIVGSRAEFTMEYTCHNAGELRWFLRRVTRFPGEGPVRVVIAHEDITAIKQAQQRAEQTQRQFHDLFEFAPDAIVMTDATDTITLVNRQAEQLFDYARGELVGQPVALLMPESNRPGDVAQRERYFTTATPRTMGAGRSNLKGRKKDGTVFPLEISLSPMESESGRLVVTAVRDITERVQAEQQMRQALATLDATEDAAFIFDPETLRFTYVNEGAVRQLGYTREELLALTQLDIKPQFTEAQFRALLDPLARGEDGKHQLTTQHRRKDGRDVPVEISLKYVAPPGERPRFIALVRDITERLAADKMVRRSQRLESIGTLAGGVAHDLNNTLAPILMAVEVLRLEYSAQTGEYLDIVEQSAKRGADMVRQLVTFAKGAEGARVLIQLRQQLNDIEKIIRSTFDKSIRLEVRQDKELAPIVGDATQIHQILLNLCVNARDAMPGGGTLTIEAGNFTADAAFAGFLADARPGPYVRVAVRDTGTGIPPEILDRIFDPFFTTKGPEKGTGLGLSTVVGIVKGHGGFLRVYSEVGRGSTFEIYLPISGADPAQTEPVTAEMALLAKSELILVVDDEAPIRAMLGSLLKVLGFTVITAADGSEALIDFGQHRAELKLIITDINMPVMDGVDLARTVKRLSPTTPIIAMTGLHDENRLSSLRDLGVIQQLAKPFSLSTLNEALRAAFSGGGVERRTKTHGENPNH